MARALRAQSAIRTARPLQRFGARIFERFVKDGFRVSILAAISAALFCVGAAEQEPSPAPSPGGTPSALPLPSPFKRPHEAPPAKMTSPPFSPPPVLPSQPLPDMLWLAQADVITVPLQTDAHRAFVQVVLNGHPSLFVLDTSIAQTSVDVAATLSGTPNE